MSGPQLEHGYTRLANELLEELCGLNITGLELRLVMTVVRLTYGYGRKEATIGLGRFRRFTKTHDRSIEKALGRLVEMNVLHRRVRRGEAGSWLASEWSLVKDSSRWQRRPSSAPAPRSRRSRYVPKVGTEASPAEVGTDPAESHTSPVMSEEPIDSNDPPVEKDALTQQLIEEGYSGLALMNEHRKRRGRTVQEAGTGLEGGTSPQCTGQEGGASEVIHRQGNVPPTRPGYRPALQAGGFKERRKETPLTPLCQPEPSSTATGADPPAERGVRKENPADADGEKGESTPSAGLRPIAATIPQHLRRESDP